MSSVVATGLVRSESGQTRSVSADKKSGAPGGVARTSLPVCQPQSSTNTTRWCTAPARATFNALWTDGCAKRTALKCALNMLLRRRHPDVCSQCGERVASADAARRPRRLSVPGQPRLLQRRRRHKAEQHAADSPQLDRLCGVREE
jgi:hypothetical protein